MEHVDIDLPGLFRDDLPQEERERIERHLAVCPSCRGAWEDIALLGGPQRRRRPAVPDGYFAALPSKIMEKRLHPVRTNWVRPFFDILRPAIPLAAGALVIIFLVRSAVPPPVTTDRLAVGANEAVDYLGFDLAELSSDLAQVVEPLLSDRALASIGRDLQETGLEDLEPTTVSEVVADLDESETDELISKLSERVIL
ncbi:MAG: zf-HC2 domain-containing protein [Bacteroidetes bacterium]|jgi:hypothetical protein|nr:zf-HC2 domain-containing protein [Bacteroidota bacterium]